MQTSKDKRDELARARQRRLRELLQTRFDGNQAELARAIDKKDAYVSFMLTDFSLIHHKKIGEQMAWHIESKLGLPKGWLDGDEKPKARGVISIGETDPTPNGYTLVKRKIINLSAGGGSVIFEEEDAPPLAFRTEWLYKERLDPDKLVVAYATGDSMEPRIHDGDMLLIDTARRVPVDGKIYAIRIGEELRVKRIYRRTVSVLLHSDNPAYPDEELSLQQAEGLHVIGRVAQVSGTL